MADVIASKVDWPNYSSSNTVKKATGDSSLGKDEFLQLLITQLSNQDPMSPLSDTEFIAQMAQFSSVEQLMNISGQLDAMSQSLGMVSGLIGKQVTWTQDATGNDSLEYSIDGENGSGTTTLSGIVESIIVKDGVQYAQVGEYQVPLTDITQIQDPSEGGSDDEANAE
ncbi:flagellar hook capping FlgD N-terminal domain-containing protein [Paenibacillus sp. M1]|uniref:Flagellar hook capping FlgD N-terminal domain-containing protein n=1 Tax=Paenibacillus haidiansis TaxID=1574488 RepID=A0ABU7VN76_9BACL